SKRDWSSDVCSSDLFFKVPRFAFEKFPAADATLTTTMKAVGEVMSFGRNFTEALQKALRSLEQNNDAELDFTIPDATETAALLEIGRASCREEGDIV